jgi:hypothetical protein
MKKKLYTFSRYIPIAKQDLIINIDSMLKGVVKCRLGPPFNGCIYSWKINLRMETLLNN